MKSISYYLKYAKDDTLARCYLARRAVQKWCKREFKYASYILRHKFFVLVAGIKIGAPLWRLLVHDSSKFSLMEWKAYATYFYGERHDDWCAKWDCGDCNCDRGFDIPKAFDYAWLHHQHHNPHHWQYWILREDDGQIKLLEMPKAYALELLADWMGASRVITGQWNCLNGWYAKQKAGNKIHLNPKTRQFVEELMEKHCK